jgi:PAS domain S-box-containing protein
VTLPEHIVLPTQGAQHGADLARETEQRLQAEAALKRSEAEYQSVFEVLHEGIAVIQADGTLSSINESAARLVHSTRALLTGKKLADLRWKAIARDGSEIPHDQHPTLITLQTGEPISGFELGLVQSDGSVKWLSINSYPLRHHENELPYAVVASFTDITKHLQHEEEMRKAYESLDKLTSEFIGVVSHELRTPITALRGALGFLESGMFAGLPPKGQELIAIARNNTDRLMRIINNILDLKRLQTGRMNLDLAPVKLTELVERVIHTQSAAAEKKRITLTAQIDVDIPVLADVDRLAQALDNLVSNSVKFSPYESEICIAARRSTMTDATEVPMVEIEVIDTGIGIAPAMLDRLFKSFVQADASNTRAPGGAGLGLAISKSIIEQMGGVIGVESEPGVRTRFWFTVPVATP